MRRTPVPAGLPPPLATTLQELLGDELPMLEDALLRTPPVSIRLNPAKEFDPGGEPVPWCSTGRYLTERPAFTFDPLLHAGAYYVQEASSMVLEQALLACGLQGRDVLALDLCAAPGGKSTHLRSLLTPSSLLVANEMDRLRQAPLQENLWKWGGPNVVVTGSTPSDLVRLPEFFDLIVLDAPCSGEGMFRKDAFAREQWTPELVYQCARLQGQIITHAWQALAPGGVLIYSTCTWEPRENELRLAHLLEQGAEPIALELPAAWGFQANSMAGITGVRAYPHRVRGEGFFLCALKKPGEAAARRGASTGAAAPPRLPFLRKDTALHHTEQNDVQHVVEERWAGVLQQLMRSLRTLAPGIPVAERKGAEWRPHPALALNELLDRTDMEHVELDLQQGISYLRGLALPAVQQRGAALALFRGKPLGWLHGAGNRWNNRYPLPWRIRAHEPSAVQVEWNRQQ